MRNEAALQQVLKRKLKERNILCYKFEAPGETGVPDLVVIDPDAKPPVYFIEVKHPNGRGRLSPKQEHEIERIKRHGGTVFVIHTLDQLEAVIRGTRAGD